jgi:hypothetical protein
MNKKLNKKDLNNIKVEVLDGQKKTNISFMKVLDGQIFMFDSGMKCVNIIPNGYKIFKALIKSKVGQKIIDDFFSIIKFTEMAIIKVFNGTNDNIIVKIFNSKEIKRL